ncbi:hypothetical protein [Rhizobium leguminosarum]|nr:hypothetical protein [Rhizobium leguminosarum]
MRMTLGDDTEGAAAWARPRGRVLVRADALEEECGLSVAEVLSFGISES